MLCDETLKLDPSEIVRGCLVRLFLIYVVGPIMPQGWGSRIKLVLWISDPEFHFSKLYSFYSIFLISSRGRQSRCYYLHYKYKETKA